MADYIGAYTEEELKDIFPHFYSDRCMIGGCKLCHKKWLEECTDTLPDAARRAARS